MIALATVKRVPLLKITLFLINYLKYSLIFVLLKTEVCLLCEAVTPEKNQ